MGSVTLARTVAATAVLGAVAVVFFDRGRQPSAALAPATNTSSPAPARAARPSEPPAGGAAEDPAQARLRELDAMSETFRNTTFLIAIRDAGFVCNELLYVYGGVNDSRTWTTSCSEMLAYTVRVANNGALSIEPALQHVDSVTPAPVRDLGGERLLPPQQQPRALPPPR